MVSCKKCTEFERNLSTFPVVLFFSQVMRTATQIRRKTTSSTAISITITNLPGISGPERREVKFFTDHGFRTILAL